MTLILCLMGVVMSAYAAPLQRYTDATAAQLLDRAGYARAVLGIDPATGEAPVSVRPYRMPASGAPAAHSQEAQP